MKKVWLLCSVVFIVGVMIFVLFNRKAVGDRKAMAANQNAFTAVSTMEVRKQALQASVTKVGTIVANNVVSVTAETSGKIIAVYANVGSYLAAGAIIAKVDDELLRSKSLSAQTAYENAGKDWARAQELHKSEVISDSELETYRQSFQSAEANYIAARREYKNANITSPISGLVTERAVNLGATVTQGTVVATIIDTSVYKVQVNVSEKEAFQLKTGDRAVAETDVYPGIQFGGRIQSISGKSNNAHTVPVEVVISDTKEHPLKSGIFGRVTFQLAGKDSALTIPRDALAGSVKNPQVYVVENGMAKLRDIVIGSEYDTVLEVIGGLKEHELVVVSGQDYLKDNAAVKVTGDAESNR